MSSVLRSRRWRAAAVSQRRTSKSSCDLERCSSSSSWPAGGALAQLRALVVLRVSCCNDGAAGRCGCAGAVFDEAGNAAATCGARRLFVPPSTSPAKDDRVSGSAESILGVGLDAVAALGKDPGAGKGLLVINAGRPLLLPDSSSCAVDGTVAEQQQLHSAACSRGRRAHAPAINEERAQQFAAVSPRKRWWGRRIVTANRAARLAASPFEMSTAANQSQEAAEGGDADGDDDLENIGERLGREQLTVGDGARAARARAGGGAAPRPSVVGDTARPAAFAPQFERSTCRPASPGRRTSTLLPQSEGATPLAPQFTWERRSRRNSSNSVARRPGANLLGSPTRVPTGVGRRYVCTLAPLPPMGLRRSPPTSTR